MAVYKPTYCQPYLSPVDPRCALSSEDLIKLDDGTDDGTYVFPAKPKFECLSCMIDTSNIDVTGYSIKLLDENNNVIFPVSGTTISPITELQTQDVIEALGEENSGINGTILKIPFFQNCNIYPHYRENPNYINFQTEGDYVGHYILIDTENYIMVTNNNKLSLGIVAGMTKAYDYDGSTFYDDETLLKSHNAIYYKPKYLVNHIIFGDNVFEQLVGESPDPSSPDPDYSQNWRFEGETKLRFNGGPSYVSSYVYLDGEPLFDGEIVFVATTYDDDDSAKFGLYRVCVDDTDYESDSISLLRIISANDIGFYDDIIITVTNGQQFHNCSFCIEKRGPSAAPNVHIWVQDYNDCWTDIVGRTIPLPINSSSVKWVLTLYQGNPSSSTQHNAASIKYSDIKERYFDIKLSTGTILGSTPERVQIASSDPIDFWGNLYDPSKTYPLNSSVIYFDGVGEVGCSYYTSLEDNNCGNNPSTESSKWSRSGDVHDSDLPAIFLPEERSGPIVLKDKFMALESVCDNLIIQNGSKTIFNSPRVYLKSYDSTYGHVYPETKALESETLSAATHCQFFKSSNNPDEILETDTIAWGVGPDWGSGGSTGFIPLNVVDSQSVVTARIIIDTDGNESLLLNTPIFTTVGQELRCLIADGELLLLTGQGNPPAGIDFPSRPDQNGVYRYNLKTETVDTGGVTTTIYTHILTRVSPYNNWAGYLGKIFYCKKGTYAGRNVSCLASAGGTLWDPNSIQSGSSSLLFSYEQPILLFPQLLPSDRVFNLFFNATYTSSISGIFIDNEVVSVGMSVLFNDGSAAVVSDIINSGDSSTIMFGAATANALGVGEYAYILSGENYGKCVLKWDDSSGTPQIGVTWDLHTARILKNMPVLTYISPYSNIKTNMALKILSGKKITYVANQTSIITPPIYENSIGSSVTSHWILINFVDKALNYVVHAIIDENSAGISDTQRGDFSYGLLSYSNDPDVPWKYDLCSYFNESNENAFSLQESSYLIFKKVYNGDSLSSGIEYGDVLPYVELTPVPITGSEFQYEILSSVVEDNIYDSGLELSYYKYKEEEWYETKRFVSIIVDYVCFNSESWENYRWVLLNSVGDIVQDTGYKYDNKPDVSFYGLNIPGTDNENITYYAVLFLTDSANKNHCSVIQICTKRNSSESSNITICNNWTYAAQPSNPGEGPAYFSATLDACSSSVLISYTQVIDVLNDNENILYSFYRREYDVYKKPGNVPVYGQYVGEWEPVRIGVDIHKDFATTNKDGHIYYSLDFMDYHVSSGRSYQYIVYCNRDSESDSENQKDLQLFANWDGTVFEPGVEPGQGAVFIGNAGTAAKAGTPVAVCWDYWNMVELISEKTNADVPIIKKSYRVDLSQVWHFKFSLETGSQTQNISRSEVQTLGMFPRIGFGRYNYISGDISALLGSEVIPYNGGYVERLSRDPMSPASTNEREALLNHWRKFVYSKNPKLLRDIKGQQWIVQITSSNNTPKNFYKNQPDTISFQWRQVGDTKDTIIYAKVGDKG